MVNFEFGLSNGCRLIENGFIVLRFQSFGSFHLSLLVRFSVEILDHRFSLLDS